MIERFELRGASPPVLPRPFDAVVERVCLEDGFLVLEFEEGITVRDAVAELRPSAWSLVIRYHLLGHGYDYYKWCGKAGKEGFRLKKPKALLRLPERGGPCITYVNHYVAFGELIVVLFRNEFIRVEMAADYVEYEWIE